jgi:resuscitation-promoting factor RpfB
MSISILPIYIGDKAMRFRYSILFSLLFLFLLASCQRTTYIVNIIADGKTFPQQSVQLLPSALLQKVGIALSPNDRLLYLGNSIPLDQPLPDGGPYTLFVRRAVTITVVTAGDQKTLKSSALTVGQALIEAGYNLFATDRLDPPAETPITTPLTIDYQPSHTVDISVDGSLVSIRTSAATVGQALAEAGIPLIGLDYSRPSENAQLPVDGHIQVVRVVESVTLTQKALPFTTRNELSADLEIDQQALLQGGEPGLSIARQRTRNEDGVQVSQQADSETIVRPPQDRIMGFGTKIVIRTATVDGVTFQYWRALTLYATYYIPCIPGTNNCMYYTSTRTLVQKGAVALTYPWFLLLAHEHVYVPGYGYGTVEDTNGGLTSAYGTSYWIDLGFGQNDVITWDTHYVTVYFLTPVPANVADMYIMP